MTAKQLEREQAHLKLNRLEDETPKTPTFKERLDRITEARKKLNEEAIAEGEAEEDEKQKSELTDPKTGQPESFKERNDRIIREQGGRTIEDWVEWRRLNPKPPTQKEIREAKRKQRQAELERAKLTQDDILAKCAANGGIKVTVDDIKNAFPQMVSQVGENNFRTQIDNKQFHDFLLSNGLTFSLPDFVFTKQA